MEFHGQTNRSNPLRLLLAGLTFFCLPAGLILLRADIPPSTCPDGGTKLRWETFARPLFAENCVPCHDWTDYTAAYRARDSIRILVWDGNMPMVGPLPQEERDLLVEWINCGLPMDGPQCPPGGTALSYGNFGLDFFDAKCSGCHWSSLKGPERGGAPADQNWDDLAAVRNYAVQIRDQVFKGLMPTGGWVTAQDAERLAEWLSCGAPEDSAGAQYRRGDANADGAMDLSDAVAILSFLFLGTGDLPCRDAADVDATGFLELTDAVYLLQFLFLSGLPPPPPVQACGSALTLGCAGFGSC